MKDNRLLPDDPKLTAYALGELTGDERAAVESALRQDPVLKAAVDEIRATAAQLEAAFATEAASRPAEIPLVRPGIVLELNGHVTNAAIPRATRANESAAAPRPAGSRIRGAYRYRRVEPKLIRFPQFYYVVATAAAACFAILVALRDTPPPAAIPTHRTVRHEIVFAPANPTGNAPAITVTIAEPDESFAAGVAVTPDAPPTEVVSSVENPQPTPAPFQRPAFLEGGLSLISQAKPSRVGARQEPAIAQTEEVPASAFRPSDASASPEQSTLTPNRTRVVTMHDVRAPVTPASGAPLPKVAETLGGVSATSSLGAVVSQASSGLKSPTAFFSNELTPPVGGPVVAGSTLPSLLPHQVSATRSSTATTGIPGSTDVVMLSPFMVNEDRAAGFAAGPASPSVASDGRGPPQRDDRPHAPPGAKFGRNTEAYSFIRDNDFRLVAKSPLSTFSIDVDTASYANVRRFLEQGSMPPRDAVRIEEMVNYFPYHYPAPTKGDVPFAASLEVADAPWAPTHRLVRIGLKAREVPTAQRGAASLVFLLDVSGSMNQSNKLPLVKQSLRSLLAKLRVDDRVAIVTYAGNSGLALPSTPVSQSREIMNALDALTPRGSANGAMGIQLAYEIAKANFVPNGINRVILCTDGDFNVGATSEGELVRLIEEQTTSGVFLTVLGFGMGNYKDATLERLADKGNGRYGYIDTRREAEKLLVEQISSTLVTVAKDVKIQVEFNPATVSSYRLIGYENRLLRKEDFNNDSIDAGEIGAGDTVTALYEIVPAGVADKSSRDDPPLEELRYAARGAVSSRLEMPTGKRDPLNNELLAVNVRYKKPDSVFSFSKTLQFPLINAKTAFARASADFRFAAAVAQFGMILRGSPYRGVASFGDVAAWAASAATTASDDPGGYRAEFVDLVRRTQMMME